MLTALTGQCCLASSRKLSRCVSVKQAARRAAVSASGDWEVTQGGSKTAWLRSDINLVLVHPLIPQNTGTTARTCAATGVGLHLVGPLGFELDDRKLKRAGLDYWDFVTVQVHADWEAFAAFLREQPQPRRLVGFSKKGASHYAAPGAYKPGDWLLFGAETTGLPPEAVAACQASGGVRRIPIDERHVRSLNLSVAAGIGLFEALRQLDGPHG